MKQTYTVEGMTCEGCKASVTKHLSQIKGVTEVSVHLEKAEATVVSEKPLVISTLKEALPSKYTISEKNIFKENTNTVTTEVQNKEGKSKLQQLKPLFLIFLFIALIDGAMNYPQFKTQALMLDFMGLFFMVFSLFKLFDLKGFSSSFAMYDPLAKMVPPYGFVYPFIEVGLGILFLMRIAIPGLLIITLVVLSITTIGVTRSLLGKRSIQCACLGTVLDLPMTQATFIENAVMIVMALVMIFGWV
ncbi:heavy-metal-associated domain-containing protein [Marinirhabdus gelatinilytica]|uniref:Copper chaperone CopZ n=1 Tax=Marinirhabdus gelatinilytica TaxID=1703343 RepID=A0A370QL92_9FLAO|nr:heavy metal-associated domain-containing protein [Marinirhabdus gelatinilytica]RDK89112.1 copper chaperone CopZ [Marinirhabdus gelatinilytica]